MCINRSRGADLPRLVPSFKFPLRGFALFLPAILAILAPDAACYATNTFGSIGGSLVAKAGNNLGVTNVLTLGILGEQRTEGGESADVNLNTSILNSNLFQFSMSAETTSAAGTAGTRTSANFQLPFVITENMRVFLTAEVVSNPSGGDLGVARIGINDGNEQLEVGIDADTGGVAEVESLIFIPAAMSTHRIAGTIITAANSPGTLSVSIQGTVAITDPSDINGDLTVDGADLNVWVAGFGGELVSSEEGDLNGDLHVNGGDLLQWQRAFGTTLGAGTLAAATVPEPAAALMVAWGIACWAAQRRRFG